MLSRINSKAGRTSTEVSNIACATVTRSASHKRQHAFYKDPNWRAWRRRTRTGGIKTHHQKLPIQPDTSGTHSCRGMTRSWTDSSYLPISYRQTCWISLWSIASSKAVWKEVKALLIWHWREKWKQSYWLKSVINITIIFIPKHLLP